MIPNRNLLNHLKHIRKYRIFAAYNQLIAAFLMAQPRFFTYKVNVIFGINIFGNHHPHQPALSCFCSSNGNHEVLETV